MGAARVQNPPTVNLDLRRPSIPRAPSVPEIPGPHGGLAYRPDPRDQPVSGRVARPDAPSLPALPDELDDAPRSASQIFFDDPEWGADPSAK